MERLKRVSSWERTVVLPESSCSSDHVRALFYHPPLRIMNTHSFIHSVAVACSILVASVASAQVTVSNVTTVPGSGVTLNQSTFSDGTNVQVRDQTGSVRAVTQTFTWNSTLALDGIGLRLATAQNTLDPVTTPVTYYLDIQQISGNGISTAASIQSTVAHLSFTISPSSVASNSYLYLDLNTNLALSNSVTYGMILYPSAAAATTQRLFFSRSADATAYTGGISAQVNNITGPSAYAGTYGGQGFDLGFYMTTAAIPEPGTTGFIVGFAALAGVLGLRRHRRG
jgi:hypothetical protein